MFERSGLLSTVQQTSSAPKLAWKKKANVDLIKYRNDWLLYSNYNILRLAIGRGSNFQKVPNWASDTTSIALRFGPLFS